jgi:single-stranded-DNA-specific exonuclease
VPRYRWIEPTSVNGSDLASLGIIGSVLATRGVTNRADAERLLSHHPDVIPDPSTLPDIETAAQLIRTEIKAGNMIAVFGDYDVDGVTSTALLVQALRDLGAQTRAYLPHREHDGYGLNIGAIDRASSDGCSLLIAVDCGTSDRAQLEHARELGLKTIVIDHHHVPESSIALPSDAFVSPIRPDSEHPFTEYCACGVAWQVLRYLNDGSMLDKYLPLVALGTVADVVHLSGPNRAIVQRGLELFDQWAGPGLQALAIAAGVETGEVKSHHFGFLLGPRINAAGRIDDPWAALNLLLTDSADEATSYASALDRLNRQRQQLLDECVAEAQMVVEHDGQASQPVLVVRSPDWRIGLVGLVASRLSDRFNRPVIALEQGAPFSRGSARSIDEFNVVEALHECGDILERFGGHAKAAGLTIETNRVDEFTQRINDVFRRDIGPEPPLPSLTLDAELDPAFVSLDLVSELEVLEPCGHGNPPPRFLIRDMAVFDARRSKDQTHLLFNVQSRDGMNLRAVAFSGGDRLVELHGCRTVDLAVSLRPNTFRGRTSVSLEVIDFRPAGQASLDI